MANLPLATFDFKDMYTALPHSLILCRLAEALEEAWDYEAERSAMPPGSIVFRWWDLVYQRWNDNQEDSCTLGVGASALLCLQ